MWVLGLVSIQVKKLLTCWKEGATGNVKIVFDEIKTSQSGGKGEGRSKVIISGEKEANVRDSPFEAEVCLGASDQYWRGLCSTAARPSRGSALENQEQLVGPIKCSWWKFTVRSRRAPRLDLWVNFHHEHFIDPTSCPGLRGCTRLGRPCNMAVPSPVRAELKIMSPISTFVLSTVTLKCSAFFVTLVRYFTVYHSKLLESSSA